MSGEIKLIADAISQGFELLANKMSDTLKEGLEDVANSASPAVSYDDIKEIKEALDLNVEEGFRAIVLAIRDLK